MNKKYYYYLVFLFIALVALSPAPKKQLVDIITNKPAAEFSVQWPALRYYIEPVSAVNDYLLSFTRYIAQLFSWIFWLALLAWLISVCRKEGIGSALARVLRFETAFLSAVVLCLVLPLPGPKLTGPKIFRVMDLHSHTFYSHDAIKSPLRSLDYHDRLGFNNYFVTEHGHTDGFGKFPEKDRFSKVFPGMQVSTTERVSLVILADREFKGAEYRDKSVREVIDLAHANGFTVFCPHWWKWRYFSWQQLYEMGIDGFEVYNAGYRNFSDAERRQLIDFCREKGLLALGTTDWHGWGGTSNVWTAIEKTGDMSKFNFESLKARAQTKVIVLMRPGELNSTFRYIFEPFFGVYYYFGSIEKKQVFYWTVWMLLFILAYNSRRIRLLVKCAPLIFAVVFFGLAGWSVYAWLPLLPENQILGKLLAPVFLGISAGWFFVFKGRNR